VGRLEELQAGDPPYVGPYLLLGRLGAGGMGRVFLGRSPGGRLVAVKVIRAELAGDPGFRARFGREVAAARRVSGVFTAPVVDADPTAPLPWLVTGFVNGPSLTETVGNYGVLPVASVLALAAGLAEGLGAVHAAGVVHRDLKPSNVLLAPDGPRVIDFGISQAIDATSMTRTGTVIGSPAFMSPEQAEGRAVGPPSDVFSLGAVLAFAATGEGPFGAGTPTAQLYRIVHGTPHLDQLPGPVRPLVERCLAKDPAQRPTAGQFLAELTAAHPTAADLTDWLPASIIPAGTLPRPAATDPAAGPAAAASGQPRVLSGSPGEAEHPAVATSGPPAPDADLQAMLTTTADRHRPGSASPAERQGADMVQPTPAAGADEETCAPPVSAAGVSPAASGSGWPTAGIAGPGSPVVAAGTAARNRRRRRLAVSGIAAAAALGAIIGLISAAPWKPPPVPPVLRPTGLTTDSATISSVAFRWSGPATGPVPDRYEIVQDGQAVGSVPGNITYYQDAGLDPDTSYQFRVIAIRNGKRSPQSVVLSVATLTPPVAAGVLSGPWAVDEETLSVRPPDPVAWIGKVGRTWTDSWTFTPDCAVGACNVTLTGSFDGSDFSASLTRAGAVYTGTAGLDKFEYCSSPTNYVPDTMHVQIQVQGADVQGSVWAASSWAGTIILDYPHAPNGNCYADTFTISAASAG